jgi:para-nitrobenzyl esterase
MIETANAVQGRLSGIRSRTGAAFLGIPYAAPPVGLLRWRPPQPAATWQGTRDAGHFSPVARQPLPVANSLYYPGDLPQSEDCLTLNIWTNAANRSERRPVMVWFHLGAFMFGSTRWPGRPGGDPVFDGSHLADLGAVVVTVNYRLNRLGFLAHPWLTAESEHGASGNYGFMDQVAALRWVRDNIAEFGGDPDNVTIFGVSAGSASCSLHIASPLSRGLFQRAIASSGGFMAPASKGSGVFDRLLTLEEAEKRGTALTDAIEVKNLDALRQVSFEELLMAPVPPTPGPWAMEAFGDPFGEGVSDTQYPIVDGYAVPDSPGAIVAAGRHNDVGLLTGSTLDDDTGLPGIETLAEFKAYVRADMGALADDALSVYAASDDASAYAASGDLIADRVFGWHNWSMARGLAAKGSKPVFYYDWTQALPIPDGYAERRRGAAHGAEMPYVFGTLDAYDWPWSGADARLSDILSRYWFNFASSGDPNGEGLPAWPPFRGEEGPAMQMAHEPTADIPTRRDRFGILDRYYLG